MRNARSLVVPANSLQAFDEGGVGLALETRLKDRLLSGEITGKQRLAERAESKPALPRQRALRSILTWTDDAGRSADPVCRLG